MVLSKSNIKSWLPLYIIFAFSLNSYLLYPGNLFYDSVEQFRQAVNGVFNLHHPPMMAFWWSMMVKIWPNPATMLVFHLLILWTASFNFYKFLERHKVSNEISKNFSYGTIYFWLPFVPWILLYSTCILKDVSFAYSYLFVASMLARFSNKEQGLNIFRIAIILLILFYGTAVKYQARFILPIFSWWLASAIINENKYRKLLLTIVIFCSIYFAQMFANNLLVHSNKEGNTNSWQYVKLYDIAAVSISTDSNKFIPDYILKSKEYNFDKIKKLYNTQNINYLIIGDQKVFINTNNKEELKQLYALWIQAVTQHPWIYIKHRLTIFTNLVKAYWFLDIWSTGNDSTLVMWSTGTNSPIIVKENTEKFLSKKNLISFLSYCSKSTSLRYWIFFLPLCTIIGVIMRKKFKDERGKTLVMMNLSGIAIMIVFIPFSLSNDGRHLLITLMMINYSLPIALNCIHTIINSRQVDLVAKKIEEQI